MIAITPLAQEKLESYLAENKVEPNVRVYVPSCGCSGGGDVLSLTLDEPGDGDNSVQAGGLSLFIEKGLSEQVGKVTIDFKDDGHDSGFVVESEKPLPAAGPSSCASCSCCD